MDWTAVVTIVTAVATLVTAGAAVLVIFIYRKQVAIGQEQVQVSQKQANLALEALYDSHRPLICPSGTLPITEGNLDWNLKEYEVALQNVGSGIALNVCGVMMSPRPTIPPHMLEPRYTLWREPRILSNAPEKPYKMRLGVVTISGEAEIGKEKKYTLFAPQKPTDLQLRLDMAYNIIARLSLTYQDIFGWKHASIYDYIDLYGWQHVASIPKIAIDLEDLERQRAVEGQRYQQEQALQMRKRLDGKQ